MQLKKSRTGVFLAVIQYLQEVASRFFSSSFLAEVLAIIVKNSTYLYRRIITIHYN